MATTTEMAFLRGALLAPALLAAVAAQPCIVHDIEPGPGSSLPRTLTSCFGDALYFAARTAACGTEPYRWDPVAGVTLLRDISPGAGSSQPNGFVDCCTSIGPRVFFSAFAVGAGRELFVSDGTQAGTVMVMDINPGRYGSDPGQFACCDGRVFFAADDGQNGVELWVSDGTAGGTSMVKDIQAGAGSNPDALTCLGDKVVFTAHTAASGRELWVSDGTPAGTLELADIRSGASSSSISSITVCGDRVFFHARDDTHGGELWTSDGTPGGTTMVLDIHPNSSSSGPVELCCCNGRVFFSAIGPIAGRELWVSDGTGAGTVRVKDVRAGSQSSSPVELTCSGARVFFAAYGGSEGEELWVTDGTEAGTTRVKDIEPNGSSWPTELVAAGAGVCFRATDSNGAELWFSDGTEVGTWQVCDLDPTGSGNVTMLTACRGQLLFAAATPSTGTEFWQLPSPGAMHAVLGAGGRPDRPALGVGDSENPVLGTTIDVVADGPAAHTGFLMAGPAALPTPPLAAFMDGGCDWVGALTPASWIVASTLQPSFVLPVTIPNQPALDGVKLHLQMWWLNPSGTPLVQVSNGLQLALGLGQPQ